MSNLKNGHIKFSIKKANIIRYAFVFLIGLIILMPRIPIMPLEYGGLSIRIDGVASALAGGLALYALQARLVIIPIFILALLYSQGSSFILMSIGFFLQVMSILLLPILFCYFGKKDSSFRDRLLYQFERIIVWYALANVIVSIVFRYFQLEICFDSVTYSGCVGAYGLLDRPYVFAVFIGAGFVFVCARKSFSILTALIMLYGLSISDSRSIAGIMFALGMVVFLKCQNITPKKFLSLISMVLVLWAITTFGGEKVSVANVSVDEIDPSWLMRLDNIERYMNWVDFPRSLLGNGTLAFYDFSEQYGVPGPIDNLYFRVASEIGIVGGAILLLLYLPSLFLAARDHKNTILFFAYVVCVAIISVFQESLVAPRAGHILVLLGICLMHKQKLDYRLGVRSVRVD